MLSENAGLKSGWDWTPEQHLIGFLQPWLTLGHRGTHMPREKKPFLGTGLQYTGERGHTNNIARQKSLQLSKNVKPIQQNVFGFMTQ